MRALSRQADLAKSGICALLAAGAFYFEVPVWFLLIFFAGYYGLRPFRKQPTKAESPAPVTNPIGELGEYRVDGEDEDPSYGLFIMIKSGAVFINIRKDELLEPRKQRAVYLHQNSAEIEQELDRFLAANPSFRERRLVALGLHSKDIDRSEAFWEPDGAAILDGLRFVKV